jgi:alkylation response protein AidB-like acyl-CoA dehydrogenase
VRNRAAVFLAFEQLGAADAALEMAAAYARERRAFGRTIGSYQGIKHKLADLYNANQLARVHGYYGAWALAADAATPAGAPELAAAAAAARVTASLAATQAAHEGPARARRHGLHVGDRLPPLHAARAPAGRAAGPRTRLA